MRQKNVEVEKALREQQLLDADVMVRSYLERAGIIADTDIPDSLKAKRLQKERQENYKNIDSLLRNYRHIKNNYHVFVLDFKEKLSKESTIAGTDAEFSFEKLANRLELLSVNDERRFEKDYKPQIMTGRRLEAALEAIRLGMRFLEKEDLPSHALLSYLYIDGDTRPTVKQVIEHFHFSGKTIYYQRLKKAQKNLARDIFGYANNKEELVQILTFLRQMYDDELEPDYQYYI